MAQKSWNVVLEDGMHTVIAEHEYFSGRVKVFADGNLLLTKLNQHTPRGLSSFYPFTLGAHEATFHIRALGAFRYVYELLIDGQPFMTGQQAEYKAGTGGIGLGWLFGILSVLAFVAGYAGMLFLSDGQPTETVIWYGPALFGFMYCMRTAADRNMATQFKLRRFGGSVALNLIVGVAVAWAGLMGNQAYWHTYTADQGAYSISVPCSLAPEAGDSANTMTCNDANMVYSVMYAELPPNVRGWTNEEILDSIAGDIEHPTDGEAPATSRVSGVKAGQLSGREYTLGFSKEDVKTRLYVTPDRIYQLVVEAPKSKLDTQRAAKYLDSFQIGAPTK